MNGVRSLSPVLFTLHNFSFFSLHCPLIFLRIFRKNGYLFIGYRECVLRDQNSASWAKVLLECPLEDILAPTSVKRNSISDVIYGISHKFNKT